MKTKLLFLISFFTIPLWSTAQTIDQSYLSTNPDNGYYSGVNQSSIIGQSFTAGLSGALTQINFDLSANSCTLSNTFTFTVDILNGEGFGGTVLATQPMTVSLPYSRTMIAVAFANPTSVTTGQKYTFRITPASNQICKNDYDGISYTSGNVHKNGTDSYSGGTSYVIANGTNYPQNADIYFTTTVNKTLAVNPYTIANNIVISPNPISENVTIALNTGNIASIKVIDALGKVVSLTKNVNQQSYNLTLHQNPGMYFIKVTNDAGVTTTKKIVKN